MYDTNFFISTSKLKKAIVSREAEFREAEKICRVFNENRSRGPFVFNIETTNFCNMTCIMCQRTTELKRPLMHMDMRTFQRIVEQIKPRTPEDYQRWQEFVQGNLRENQAPSENNFYFEVISRSVTLHGFGEPLLDPMLPDRVALMTQSRIPSYFSCIPNNIRLDLIKELFQAKLGYIKFAVDSLDDARAREIRGKKADFTRAYELILEVLELKKKMQAETVIVMTMLDFFGEGEPESETRRFQDLWTGRDVYAYVKSLDNKWLLSRKGKQEKAKGQDKSHYSKQYCEFPWTSITILADGSVVPCTQDLNGRWVFGNVNEESLAQIWGSPKYQEFRRMHVTGDFAPDFMCHSSCDLNLVSYFLKP